MLLAALAFLASTGMRISGLADGEGLKTYVEAPAKVPKQIYDWCRNKRLVAKLSQAIDTDAVSYRERDPERFQSR